MEFTITAMHCQGCVRGVTAAIRDVDPAAEVSADLDSHLVRVTTRAEKAPLVAALTEAGYAPD